MRVVDAVWEKRNLGVTTTEITIEKEDILADVDLKMSEINSEYTVVKIPSELDGFLAYFQDKGYTFVEDMIHIEHDLKEYPMNPIVKRLYDKTSFRRMNDEDYKQMQDEISKGMFSSDRVSRDKSFDSELAAKRYVNWTDDLNRQGALFYVITYGDEGVGFVVLSTKDGVSYESVLGGGYEKYRKTGMGIIQKEQEITRSLGGKRVTTSVSSNNVNQFRALILNGYKPYSIDHILVKHKEACV